MRDVRGRTPLHYAAAAGRVDAVSTLVREMGARVDAVDIAGIRPFQYALDSVRPDIADML